MPVGAGADRDDKPFKWLDATFHVKVPVLAGGVLRAAGALIVARPFVAVRRVADGSGGVSGAAFLLIVTMIVASLAPAHRASRVGPIEVLRAE